MQVDSLKPLRRFFSALPGYIDDEAIEIDLHFFEDVNDVRATARGTGHQEKLHGTGCHNCFSVDGNGRGCGIRTESGKLQSVAGPLQFYTSRIIAQQVLPVDCKVQKPFLESR